MTSFVPQFDRQFLSIDVLLFSFDPLFSDTSFSRRYNVSIKRNFKNIYQNITINGLVLKCFAGMIDKLFFDRSRYYVE